MNIRSNLSRTFLFSSAVVLSASTLVGCNKPAEQHAATSSESEAQKPLDQLTLTTSWYPQAEHGGFYQAAATGIYKKYGLDVTIKQGGPQVNGMTLLLAKNTDIIINYDLQVLKGVEQGFPVKAIATSFQYDPQGIITHGDVNSLADLKGKTILVATSGQTSWWPWLKAKYNLNDGQVRPYTFNLQPFLADKNTAQQGYATSEVLPAKKADPDSKFFLFAHDGYPAYGGTLVTRDDVIAAKPDVIKRFIKASAEGWKSYLENPAPANAIIKKENPQMTDEVLSFALDQIKELKLVTGGDAETSGIGVMTEARWKATRDMMVASGLLKDQTDWKKAFTLQFVPPATKSVK
ncbi:ABC transporter substrate-binding protein [Acinetobacter populi]|uniref:Bicyclomycin resistance protein n=1 Tax=Acinetobacter populi TaxID=1582270 RepID=A0A1Z9YX30_9GAMM|nr:ABC transporter substrate-binding protein [Acinetobacter populi]OUY06765.1 bicyclomycin resistance protein [Acinetobacter populi]